MSTETDRLEKLRDFEQATSIVVSSYLYQIRLDYESDPQKVHRDLVSLSEVLLKYLTYILVSDYRQLAGPGLADSFKETIGLLKQPSMGQWATVLQRLAETSRKSSLKLVFPSLPEDLLRKSKADEASCAARTELAEIIRKRKKDFNPPGLRSPKTSVIECFHYLTTYRNAYHGHGAPASEYEVRSHLPILTDILLGVLERVTILTSTRLGYLKQVMYKDSKHHHTFFISEGKDSNLERYMYISTAIRGHNPDLCYVCEIVQESPARVRPILSVHPMIIYRHDEGIQGPNFFCLEDISGIHVGYKAYPRQTIYEPQKTEQLYKSFLELGSREELVEEDALIREPEKEGAVKERSEEGDQVRNPGGSRVFELVRPKDNPQIWENFEGEYYAYNAPFQLEKDALKLGEMVGKHAERYRNDNLTRAHYVFFTGDLDNPHDAERFSARLANFELFMSKLRDKIPDLVSRKLIVSFCRDDFPNLTFFAGRKMGGDYAVIYFHDDVFMEDDVPLTAFLTKDSETVETLREKFRRTYSEVPSRNYSVDQILDEKNLLERLREEFAAAVGLRPSVLALKYSPTLEINEAVRRRRARGDTVFHMGFGESPFPVPTAIADTLAENVDKTMYLPTAGLEELRERVLDYYATKLGLADDEFIPMIGPGSKELIYDAQLAVDGDLLLPVPSWVSYGPQALLISDEALPVETSLSDRHHVTPRSLEEVITAAKRDGRNPRKIILNYPNNPTGLSPDASALEGIAEVCRRHEVMVISDEIYGFVRHQGEHVSIARFYPEGTIVTAGISKHLSLGGYRLGIALIPVGARKLFDAMCRIGSETWSAVSSPIQYAAVTAFEGREDVESHIRTCAQVHALVAGYVRNRLRETGVEYPETDGAFYLYPDFEHLRVDLKSRHGVGTGEELARGILDSVRVATLPGPAFADDPQRLRLRLALCDYDGKVALKRFLTDPEGDPAEFVGAVCPRIAEACDRLVSYFVSG